MTDDSKRYTALSPSSNAALRAGPFVLLASAVVLASVPLTRQAARWVFYTENGPVEIATFVLAMMGGVKAVSIAARGRRLQLDTWAVAFYVAFGTGLLLTGMEEVAWGQTFFHWRTPDFWAALNAQGETTLHNFTPIQRSTELFRLVFGVGGLIGIACWRYPALERVATPRALGPLMALIASHALLDAVFDEVAPGSLLEKGFSRTSELMEMYVAAAGWLYPVLNARRLEAAAHASALVAESGGAPHLQPAANDPAVELGA